VDDVTVHFSLSPRKSGERGRATQAAKLLTSA
jgi:hypothetical protein